MLCCEKSVLWNLRPETLKNDSKIQKNSNFFENVQNVSNCFRMRPNASQWIRMDQNGSEHIQKPRKTRENFEEPRENFETLCENFRKNYFHDAVWNIYSWF